MRDLTKEEDAHVEEILRRVRFRLQLAKVRGHSIEYNVLIKASDPPPAENELDLGGVWIVTIASRPRTRTPVIGVEEVCFDNPFPSEDTLCVVCSEPLSTHVILEPPHSHIDGHFFRWRTKKAL